MSTRLDKQFNGQGWLRIPGVGIQIDSGPTVPSDGAIGWGPNAIFIDNDATGGDGIYINTGTLASAAFRKAVPWAATNELVSSGASLTISSIHHGKTILQAAASAITLPAATGSGLRVRFVNLIAATTVTITANGAYLYGTLIMNTDSAFQGGTLFTVGAAVSAGSTIITQDGTTRGGAVGDWIEIQDIATNKWSVHGILNASGTEATPFS